MQLFTSMESSENIILDALEQFGNQWLTVKMMDDATRNKCLSLLSSWCFGYLWNCMFIKADQAYFLNLRITKIYQQKNKTDLMYLFLNMT